MGLNNVLRWCMMQRYFKFYLPFQQVFVKTMEEKEVVKVPLFYSRWHPCGQNAPCFSSLIFALPEERG